MATKKRASKKRAPRRAAKRKNAARPRRPKSVSLRNFTGRVVVNRDKTVSILGRGRRGKG